MFRLRTVTTVLGQGVVLYTPCFANAATGGHDSSTGPELGGLFVLIIIGSELLSSRCAIVLGSRLRKRKKRVTKQKSSRINRQSPLKRTGETAYTAVSPWGGFVTRTQNVEHAMKLDGSNYRNYFKAAFVGARLLINSLATREP
jgi:hypothetical protein